MSDKVLLLILLLGLCFIAALGGIAARLLLRRTRLLQSELRRLGKRIDYISTTTGSTRPLVEQTREIVGMTDYNLRALKVASEERTAVERDVAWLRSAWEVHQQPGPTPRELADRRERWANPSQLRVAAILDEFSFAGFAPECELIELLPDNWREVMDQRQPDLFLCESAWAGRDPVAHPWQGKIYTRESAPQDRRAELLAILDYCRLRGIPTVFWNKEDPVHSEDPERNFLRTALEFDCILTTDQDSLPRYEALGRPDAKVLQFAYQPQIYRAPTQEELAAHPRENTVVFAGGWYADHPARGPMTERLLDAVLASPYDLVIHDRYWGQGDPLHEFPERYRPYCRPPVSQQELAEVYRRSLFGLTINTVTSSPTMYARRAYEVLASGAVLLSNYSVGLERDFGEQVVFLDRRVDALERMTPAEVLQRSAAGILAVAEHTYATRLCRVTQIALTGPVRGSRRGRNR